MAYGVKSDDGKRFIKNERLREEFASSEAYSVLFMEIVTDADAAAKFINAVIPAGLIEEAANTARQEPLAIQTEQIQKPAQRIITRAELEEMTGPLFAEVAGQLSRGEAVLENE